MTKIELVPHVAESLPCVTPRHTEVIVNTIFDRMPDALAQGDSIEIRGFGSLKVRSRGARQGHNPKTSESVHVLAKKLPLLKIGKGLLERINQTVASAGSMEEDS
jgi:integration host factor subunit beta